MRIDPALWQELERWAADDLRSVNGQIEFILRQALKRRGIPASTDASRSAEPGANQDSGTEER